MKIKCSLFVATLFALSQTVFAEGPSIATPVATASSDSYLYFEAQVGYSFRNWQDFNDLTDVYRITGTTAALLPGYLSGASFAHGKGGIAWGVDAGYQFNHYLAIEAMYFMLQNTTWSNTFTIDSNTSTNGTISSWLAGAALKLSTSLSHNLVVYLKVGPGYVHDQVDNRLFSPVMTTYSLTNGHIAVLFGAGLQYNFASNVYAGVQYLYVSGDSASPSTTSEFRTPSMGIVTGTLGYSFNM